MHNEVINSNGKVILKENIYHKPHEIKDQGHLSHVVGMPQRTGATQELAKWDWTEKLLLIKGEDSGELELGSKLAFKIKSCNS